MSTTYISSDKLSVFPLAKNRADRSSRLFYENNIANLLRQLVDVEGFIISKAIPTLTLEGTGITLKDNLDFNLYGYYFSIHGTSEHPVVIYTFSESELAGVDSAPLTFGLWAEIDINDSTQEINEIDVNNFYRGLSICCYDAASALVSAESKVIDGDTPVHTHRLKLFDITLSNVNGNLHLESNVNAAAYQKFSANSIDSSISKIDGKPLR